MSAEVWAILGLALVVWLTGAQIVAKLDKLHEAVRRPTKPNGDDEVLEELRAISGYLHNAEIDRMP